MVKYHRKEKVVCYIEKKETYMRVCGVIIVFGEVLSGLKALHRWRMQIDTGH